MFGLGAKELIIIVAVVVLLFGSKKLPELAKGIAEGIQNLRGGFKDTDNVKSVENVDDTKSVENVDKEQV